MIDPRAASTLLLFLAAGEGLALSGCSSSDREGRASPTTASDTSSSSTACAYYGGNGPSVYGGQNGLTDTYAAMVDSARLGALRLNLRLDGHDAWDEELLLKYDAYVRVAREHGYEILGLVSNETVSGDQTSWNAGYDGTGYSAYVQRFVSAVSILMNRYGGAIKTWEIWNEPNAYSNPSYASDPANAGGSYIVPLVYAKMLAETSLQNRSAIESKGLHLVTGGLFAHDIGGSFSTATDYLGEVLAQSVWDWMEANTGRRYPWDGVGYHLYVDQGGATSSDHIMRYIDAVQAAKVGATDFTPLWITEFGWRTSNVAEDVQASNTDIALRVFESRGDVARTFVFKVEDYDSWGLFHGDRSAKQVVSTYRAHTVACAAR